MCPAAARLTDPIAHTSMLGNLAKMGGSLIVGALIGAAITAAVAALVVATVATGGLGLVAVLAIGFGVSVAMEASGLNGFIDRTINRAVDALIPPSIEGKIASGFPTVRINSLLASRAASPGALDVVACAMHSSGPPPMLAQGSDNVYIGSQPAARKDDMTTCGGKIAGGSPDVFIGGGTLTVREIEDERPWWIAALGVAIGVALTLCGRGKMNLSALKSAVPCLLMNMGASLAGSYVGHKIRTAMGNPVNVITGGKVLSEAPEFVLPGPMTLEWARFYSSHDRRDTGLFGPGWSVHYEVELSIERDALGQVAAVHYCDEQGRPMTFPALLPGHSHFSTAEGYYLIHTELGQYLVESTDGIYRDFGVPAEGFAGTLKLQRLEDRNGNWHALRYAADGRLREMNDGCGRSLAFDYDTLFPQRLAAVHLARGAEGEPAETLARYRYSARGELAEVINRAGDTIRMFAYRDGLMTEHTVPRGLRCRYDWEGSGANARVIRHWTDDGESYDFRYDLTHRRTLVTDQIGRQYLWSWSEDKQPTEYTDPEGNLWLYEWDRNRQLVQLTDPLGAVTRCEYDDAGRLTTTINALGQIEKTEWHESIFLPVAEINAAGNRWSFDYDQHGNLILSTDPEGHVTEQFHDSRGLPHTIRDARGGHKHIDWNLRALPTRYLDCSGKETRFAYDERGVLARVTDALGNATRYEADALGRVTQIVNADGGVQKFRYDALGRLCASVDAAEHETQYVRNPRGLITRRINALGRSVEFVYDAAYRLERLINENGEAYRFAYDRNDNLVQETGLDGVIKRIEHDERGMPVTVIDAWREPDALTLRMQRDALGRLTAKHARGRSTLFRYDQVGQLLQAQLYSENSGARTVHDNLAFSYSKRGELLTESGHLGTLAHQYDELGNRIATTLPDGRTINSLYYGSGHLHQINIDGEVISDMERDDLHREVWRSQGMLASRFGYDKLGRKTWERAETMAAHEPVLQKEWHYDLAGELTQKRHSRNGVTNYLYDPLGRILSTANEAQRELFNWDAAANLVDGAHQGGYVKHNRVMVFEDKRYEYDVHGRMESKRIGNHTEQSYSYDGEHRLRQVATTRNGVTQLVYFEYDALGRRIRKHDAFGKTHFMWDGLRMIQERRGSDTISYVYETDSFEPLARIDTRNEEKEHAAAVHVEEASQQQQGRVYHFHNDVSGQPEELSDSHGCLAWSARYQTYGNTVAIANEAAEGQTSPRPQNVRFQGQYLDQETGLHYNTYRFYDPDIGRFISPDPIGLNGGMNLFAYAPNPLGWVDPLGLSCSSDARKLGQNLGPAPGPAHNPHHITMSNSKDVRMKWLRRRMDRLGIDVNDPRNGIWLPNNAAARTAAGSSRTLHAGEGLHGNAYKDHVWQTLKGARTVTDFENGLAKIHSELMSGKVFPLQK